MGVITGRCIPDIRAKVDIRNITYAGNHGVDIRHPDGTRFVPPMPEEVSNLLRLMAIAFKQINPKSKSNEIIGISRLTAMFQSQYIEFHY